MAAHFIRNNSKKVLKSVNFVNPSLNQPIMQAPQAYDKTIIYGILARKSAKSGEVYFMTLIEKLESVQYVTDGEGNRQAVLLALPVWEEILALVKIFDEEIELMPGGKNY